MRTKQLVMSAIAMVLGLSAAGCRGGGEMEQVQQQRAGDYQVTLLAPGGQLEKGQNRLALEFQQNGQPAEVGNVQVSSTMPMPGMPTMVAPVSVKPAGQPGRYEGTISFEMSGGWDMAVAFADGQRAQLKVQVRE